MSELFYLDEINIENTVHNYKLLKPLNITNEYIEYKFPEGNYLVDCIYLSVKFNKQIIQRNNLLLEDLVDFVIPYYNNYINDSSNNKQTEDYFDKNNSLINEIIIRRFGRFCHTVL